MSSEFPRFKNSFSEKATDQHKTRFNKLSGDDFFLRNQIKTKAKFKLQNGGHFKLTNNIKTKEQDDSASYIGSTDVEITGPVPHTSNVQGRLIAKEGKGIQLQADFGKRGFKWGNVVPYLQFDTDNTFKNLTPSAGFVWLHKGLKAHGLLTKNGKNADYEESGVYKNGPWTLAYNANMTFNTFALNYYHMTAAWQDKDSEISIEAGSNSAGWKKPEFVNLNLWFSKCIHKFGLQIANNTNNWKERGIRFVVGTEFSDELSTKAAFDNDSNVSSYINYKWAKGAEAGLSFHMKHKQTEGFKGYLDYPFNFGLEFKFDN